MTVLMPFLIYLQLYDRVLHNNMEHVNCLLVEYAMCDCLLVEYAMCDRLTLMIGPRLELC